MESVNRPKSRLKASIEEQVDQSTTQLKKAVANSKQDDAANPANTQNLRALAEDSLSYAKANPGKVALGLIAGFFVLRSRAAKKLIAMGARASVATGLSYAARRAFSEQNIFENSETETNSTIH